MFQYVPFYTVIVLKIDVFESVIVDERHFANAPEALVYADTMKEAGYIPVVAQMQLFQIWRSDNCKK